jgi:riboflavin kinase/FMN adenylyltransferase
VRSEVVALGSFDGIHIGHLAVVGAALAADPSASVVCFEPLPRQVLSAARFPMRLTTPLERMEALREAGVGPVTALPFDESTRGAEPPEFLDRLRALCGFRQLVVGYDFHFGRNRSGNVERLGKWCAGVGVGLIVVPEVTSGGSAVKSERIRALLRAGALPEAGALLGRRYSAIGAVARGRGVGRELGFPTLNIRVPDSKLLPRSGSYSALVRIEGGAAKASAAFVPDAPGLVEAHIPGWSGDAYSEMVGIEFLELLRPAERGLDKETLKRRIEGDVERAMEVAQE